MPLHVWHSSVKVVQKQSVWSSTPIPRTRSMLIPIFQSKVQAGLRYQQLGLHPTHQKRQIIWVWHKSEAHWNFSFSYERLILELRLLLYIAIWAWNVLNMFLSYTALFAILGITLVVTWCLSGFLCSSQVIKMLVNLSLNVLKNVLKQKEKERISSGKIPC